MILRLFLYSSQPPWLYLGYPYTHHSLFGGPQSIPNHITFCFVVLSVSLYRVSSQSTYWLRQSLKSSQSTWWLTQSLYSSQSPSWYPVFPFTHHSLPGGTRTIPILITVSLVVLRVSLYSSQSPWLMSDYPYTHHSFPRGTQTIPLLIKSALWYSNYPFTHHSLPGGTQSIPILIKVSLAEFRLYLYSSQTPSWYSNYLYTHHSLPGGTQTIH